MRRSLLMPSYFALVVFFLLFPIAIVIPISFIDAQFLQFPPQSYSLRWYRRYFTDPDFVDATLLSLGVALGLVVVYLALSINVYLESAVFGAFRLGYGRLGPTEVRIILIALNTGLALHRHVPGLASVPIRLVADVVCGAATLGMLALLVGRFARNLRDLARLEPPRAFSEPSPSLSGTPRATSPG